MDCANRVALVNGGAGGLGGGTVRRLAALGAGGVIVDTHGDGARALAEEIGARAIAVEGDQVDDGAVAAAIEAARSLGTFDICVNAAGAVALTPPVADAAGTPHDMESFEYMVRMHLFGPFNVTRLAAASFAGNTPNADGERGVVINTASTAAFEGQALQVAYSASKGAIRSMTPSLARDLAAIGVRANAIAPGPIMTPRMAQAPAFLTDALISNVAFPKRLGHADEYGLLVEAIVRNPFLNGQVIRLDGAMSTQLALFGTGTKG